MSQEEWRDSTTMPFGKHNGKPLAEVPASYLLWCWDQADMMKQRPGLRAYIEKGLKELRSEAKNERR